MATLGSSVVGAAEGLFLPELLLILLLFEFPPKFDAPTKPVLIEMAGESSMELLPEPPRARLVRRVVVVDVSVETLENLRDPSVVDDPKK